MTQRTIDLNRCLCNYPHSACQQCADACPRQAIVNRQIDKSKCDNCGLCTAICPTGAIQSETDYDQELSAVLQLAPPVLMCQKASPQGFPCLGFLSRRLLWALAEKQPLAIDISRCADCKPAVAGHLHAEIAACNAALDTAALPRLKLVKVKPRPQPSAPSVGRRSFFKSLFKAASKEAVRFSQSQRQYQYAFDPVVWLAKEQVSPCALFPGLQVSSACSRCGLCINLCPEKALQLAADKLSFTPTKCTGCGLCAASCPAQAIELLPSYDGQQEFILRNSS